MLVEDDVDNLELLAACLEAEGASVFSAGSIASALAMTIGERIDVVVSDLELPDGEGCALRVVAVLDPKQAFRFDTGK